MMPIRYINNRGTVLDLNSGGIVCSPTDAIAWDLDASEVNGKVAAFTTGVTTKELDCATYTMTARQKLYEVPAYDVADMKPGRLYVGDWYLICYVTASQQESWWRTDGHAKYTLTITVEDPHWRRDTTYVYTERKDGGRGLDFQFDFAFDFGYAPSTVIVNNTNYLSGDAIIRMYGPSTNPDITIGENTYGVDVTLEQGDYVEISTYDKTVKVVRLSGETENGFPLIAGDYSEGSGSYIFQKIATGSSDVTWDGNFDFDVVMVERRNEPRWD